MRVDHYDKQDVVCGRQSSQQSSRYKVHKSAANMENIRMSYGEEKMLNNYRYVSRTPYDMNSLSRGLEHRLNVSNEKFQNVSYDEKGRNLYDEKGRNVSYDDKGRNLSYDEKSRNLSYDEKGRNLPCTEKGRNVFSAGSSSCSGRNFVSTGDIGANFRSQSGSLRRSSNSRCKDSWEPSAQIKRSHFTSPKSYSVWMHDHNAKKCESNNSLNPIAEVHQFDRMSKETSLSNNRALAVSNVQRRHSSKYIPTYYSLNHPKYKYNDRVDDVLEHVDRNTLPIVRSRLKSEVHTQQPYAGSGVRKLSSMGSSVDTYYPGSSSGSKKDNSYYSGTSGGSKKDNFTKRNSLTRDISPSLTRYISNNCDKNSVLEDIISITDEYEDYDECSSTSDSYYAEDIFLEESEAESSPEKSINVDRWTLNKSIPRNAAKINTNVDYSNTNVDYSDDIDGYYTATPTPTDETADASIYRVRKSFSKDDATDAFSKPVTGDDNSYPLVSTYDCGIGGGCRMWACCGVMGSGGRVVNSGVVGGNPQTGSVAIPSHSILVSYYYL